MSTSGLSEIVNLLIENSSASTRAKLTNMLIGKTEQKKPKAQKKAKKRIVNPYFSDVRPNLSVNQVKLAMYMTEYRRKFNISQKEMAKICSEYGVSDNVKFVPSEIFGYENYLHIPTQKKFQVLTNVLHIDPTCF